ncbi:MAG: cobalamin biosynthesis protein [Alphaproteobacteria bacterium]|nr:cobalamin biosynthesis protein [Alphaproteobacteria bacterium]
MVEFLSQWHAELMNPDRIPYALISIFIALVIGMITGPLAGNANPFLWIVIDKVFGELGDRLDRTERTRSDLVFRGFLLTALVLFFSLVLGKIFEWFVLENSGYGLVEVIILSLLITIGSVWFSLLRLYFALEKGEVGKGAYYAISVSTRKNLTAGDDFGIIRSGMGLLARSFDKGMVSPIFWYLIGGIPLAIIYSSLSGLAWRFGKDGFSKGFGSVSMTLERLLGFVPSLMAAVFITMSSSITSTSKVFKNITSWLDIKNRAPYEQGGFPLSALAWVLNVSLGGASQDITGSAIKGEWIGSEGATAQIDYKHLRRAIYSSVIAHILFIACLCGMYLWGGGFDFREMLDFSG